jgi:hypothetical protein
LNNKELATNLFKQLKNSPFFDTTIRPLTLAHLCAIYEREGKIPEKPRSVYRKVINLLLEEWNLQRNISRESHYSNFEIDRKSDFLAYLAYQLTIENSSSVFSREDLNRAYLEICENFSLPKKEATKVVDELESHNGLFIQSGYERFQFPHKSIQEFLTAEFLVKSFALPDINTLLKIPNELALAVSIASVPSTYFAALILNYFKENLSNSNFIEPFINRILIEKPDFKPSLEMGVSFAYIYHSCTYGGSVDFTEYGNYYPNLRKLLDKLFIDFSSISKSVKMLKVFYEIKGMNPTTGDEILLTRNSKTIKDRPFKIDFPEKLIIRAIYIDSE